MGLFDAPEKAEDGVWHTNKFAQLYADAQAVLSANPASWLGAIGLVLLLKKLGALYGSRTHLLVAAGLTDAEQSVLQPFFDTFTDYTLPKGYAVDADPENPLVTLTESEVHEDKRELTVIDLIAFKKLVQKCCDVVSASWSGELGENDKLKSK